MQDEKIRKLRLAKRSETIKRNRKKFSNNCQQFLSQPYQFARNVIAPKAKGELASSKEAVQEHLKMAHSDAERSQDRRHLESLLQYETPGVDYDDKVPSIKEFTKKLRKTRSKSAPGPNGVPYLVYKRCPGIAKQLWGYLKDLWKKNVLSNTWREAEGVFIPKENGATSVDKFRTISLLNVEGKIFFSLKADRITTFLMQNRYIDNSIQKGGTPGVSGCLEHTAILSQLIKEAKKERKNLVVTWLDIANAYGSIPHNVIGKALEGAHVPEETRKLIGSYYDNVKIRFTTDSFTTEWQRVEKGIITGCTLSVVLFALTMSWLVESVKKTTKGPKTTSGQRQLNSRLFMDDITTTTETLPQTRDLLTKLSEKLEWAGLKIKPEKCRSLVIIKGKIKTRDIKINGKTVTPIQEMPVKYLGKEYKASLGEGEQLTAVTIQLKEDLKKIERCRIPGRYKSWIVQHMLLPRIMWPLSIYNFPVTKIEKLHRMITTALKRWLKIPRSLSSHCFYSHTSRLRLPFSSLLEETKAAKARNLVTFEGSKDPHIRNSGIAVDAGRKADTSAEVKEAKSRLQMKEIIGVANRGREGLGMRRRQYYSSSSAKEQREMVVKTVREKEEECRLVKMTSFSNQGANLKWEVPQRRLKHSDIIKTSEESLSFLVKAVYDLLPTPANKNRWFKQEEKCKLCGQDGTLNHILSGCRVALSQGRYTWRHNKVLKEVVNSISTRMKENVKKEIKPRKTMAFIKEGEKSNQNPRNTIDSFFDSAKDWTLSVDLERQLKIPIEVTITNLRPDIIVFSKKTKQLGVVELTVPSEDRIEISGELKRAKYERLVHEGHQKGWKVRIWAIEVGCRGFPAVSLSTFMKDIGYQGQQRKRTVEKIGQVAESASHSLWKASHYKNWGGINQK